VANIYSAGPGAVVSIGDQSLLPLRVAMTGWGGFSFFKALITEAAVQRSGRYQFLYTLRDFIYVYIFGEALGEINISGVAFSNVCPDQSTVTGVKTGFEYVLSYYEQYRLSRTGAPVIITIGTTSFQAFLTNIALTAQDPQTQLSSFKMRFLFPPNPRPLPNLADSILSQLQFIGQFLPPLNPSKSSLNAGPASSCCTSAVAGENPAPTIDSWLSTLGLIPIGSVPLIPIGGSVAP